MNNFLIIINLLCIQNVLRVDRAARELEVFFPLALVVLVLVGRETHRERNPTVRLKSQYFVCQLLLDRQDQIPGTRLLLVGPRLQLEKLRLQVRF